MELSIAEKAEVIQLIERGLPLPAVYCAKLFPEANLHTDCALPEDLARLREAQAALQLSEERWKFALEGAGDGVWDWNISTGEVFYSKRWKEMLGFTDAGIENKLGEWERLVHPEDLAQVQAEIQRHLAGETPFYTTEHRILCQDGSYKWILDRGKVVCRDTQGQPLRMVGTHTDLTQAKQTQERLQQNEYWLSESQRVSRIGSYVLDIANGDWTSTATLDEIFGIDAGYPHNVQGWGEIVHPGHRVMMVDYFTNQVVSQRQPFDKVYRILRPADGVTRWVHGLGALFFDANGVPVRMAGTIQDVTERVLAEQELRQEHDLLQTLIDTIPDPVFIKDRESRFVRINQSQARLLGVPSPKQAEGKSDADYYNPSEAAWRLAGELEIMATGKPQIGLTERIEQPGKPPLWLSVTKIARYDEAGEVIGTLGISHDITEIISAQEELRKHQQRYSALVNTTKDGFAVLDAKGIVLEVNDAYCAMMGYSREELVGRPVTELDFLPPAQQTTQRLEQLLTQGWAKFETQHQRCDGLMVDIEINATVTQPSNQVIIFLTDIRERHRAQQQLRNMAEMLEMAPSSITVHDAQGKFRYFNRRAHELHGYTADDFAQTNLFSLNAPGSRELIEPRIEQLMEAGETSFEVEHYRKDGSVFPLLVHSRQAEWEGQAVILAAATDISELRQAEAALRESEARFRTIFEAEPECVKLVGLDGTLLNMNPAGLAMLETDREQALGRSILEWIKPEWHAALGQRIQELAAGTPFSSEFEIIGSKGTQRWLETHAVPLRDAQGIVTTMLAVTRDITQRKQAEQAIRESEERLRKLFNEVVNIAVQGYGPDGTVRLWNTASEQLYGYTAQEALGRNLVDLIIPPEMRDFVRQAIREMMESGVAHPPEELMLMRKDGSLVPVFSNHTIIDTQGIGKELFCIDIDLTERKLAEAEQLRLQEQLRQAQKLEALGTLAGGIAHDFNNILFAILGFTDLLEESMSPDPEQQDCLSGIKSGSTRAAELVKQILTFARRSSRQRTEINIVPLIEESLKLLRSTLPAYIEISRYIEPVSAVITADPTEVHQILMNLCTNAGQAMLADGGKLAVSLTVVLDYAPAGSATRPAYKLTVHDTGPGIPENLLGMIFDPFFTTKPVGEGTGMGLAVVHSIVQELGGKINVESTPGTGTVFTVLLPASSTSPIIAVVPGTVVPRGVERVLVVDDEPAIVNILQQMLSQLGYKVSGFTDTKLAAEAFHSNPAHFDAVILDQAMRGATGSDLAKLFLQVRPRLPIVLCTGHSHTLTQDKAQALGIAKFLYKPVSRMDLAVALREALDACANNSP
jgi:PAS domain S-box-containing protein